MNRFGRSLAVNQARRPYLLLSLPRRRSVSRMPGDVYHSQVRNDGRLYISLTNAKYVDEILLVAETTDLDHAIPETVLQYERQLRKIRAADRAGGPVTKDEHLRVVYDDSHLVVVNKPSGILCVPGINHNPCLLNLVHDEYAPCLENKDQMIVHRLDMDTSGLVVFGKTVDVVSALQKAFRERNVEKEYQALVCGHVIAAEQGVIDLPLQRDHERPPFMRVSTTTSEHAAAQAVVDLQNNGYKKLIRKRPKPSQTSWKVLERTWLDTTTASKSLPVTRLQLTPMTGRTHQLRVHCAAMGFPIVGDPAYGLYGEASANGGFSQVVMDQMTPHRASIELQKNINDAWTNKPMCLHANRLSLVHPITGTLMKWEAPTPF